MSTQEIHDFSITIAQEIQEIAKLEFLANFTNDNDAAIGWCLAECFDTDEERAFYYSIFFQSLRADGLPSERVFRLRRFDDHVLYAREFRQRFRIPMQVLERLEDSLEDILAYPSLRNRPLTVRQQLLIFLSFAGTNSFYHVLRDCTGITEGTICRTVHRYAAHDMYFHQ